MIPKLIHQTAKTAEIPPKWAEFQGRLKELHPGWTYKLWTDVDNQEFVAKEYPDFLRVFNGLPKNIMRADVIRYLLMYRLGGMYMDLDYEMLKPFDMGEHDIVVPWERELSGGDECNLIGNAFFASVPGHPFWKMAIDDLAANPPKDDSDIIAATGPVFLTRIMEKAEAGGMTFHRPARELFNPPSPRGRREYEAILRRNVAYGIHHCHGSWREFDLQARMRIRVSGLYHRIFG